MLHRVKEYFLQPAKINEANRAAWIQQTLLALPRGLRILDAGAGEAPYREFCAGQTYITQDFAKYDGIGDGHGLQTGTWNQNNLDIISDITKIPEKNASFDVIICTEVLEHIPDPLAALAEFDRLLKVGGTLIMTVPFWSATHFAPYHYITGYNRYFFEEHLVKKRGYILLEMKPSGSFFQSVGQEIVRLPGISKRYSSKVLAYCAWLFILPLSIIIRAIARRDTGSSELLCFEHFIRAQKLS